jgi:hypothetical protein
LVVNGNLKCVNFDFPFQAVVTGSIYADNIRIDSGCDYYLTVGGDIHAKSVIEDGHVITVLGGVYSPVIKSYLNEFTIGGEQVEISEREEGEDSDEDA